MSPEPVALQRAREAKDRLVPRLREHPDVNGVGLARAGDGWVVKVNLVREAPDLDLPAEIDGVPVSIEVVGRIRAREP